MGDPKKARKKYKTPSHPWQKARLDEETELAKEFGLKNKKEIWKMNSILTNFTNQSKKLVTLQTKQADVEKINLIKRLKSLGLLNENQTFEDILNLNVKNIMERRLETFVHRGGLAKSMKQARQFITHSHIFVGDRMITSPSYLVRVDEASKITFRATSAIADSSHPERIVKETAPAAKPAVEKSDEKKEAAPDKKEDVTKEKKKKAAKKTKPKKEKKEKAKDAPVETKTVEEKKKAESDAVGETKADESDETQKTEEQVTA